MLEHAHRADLVERLAGCQRAVVEQLHVHAVLQPAFGDQPLHVAVLVVRERDARGRDAVVLRRPQQQRTPARADVQETLAGPQVELAADVVQLRFLGLGQRHLRIAEIGAGIDTPRIQPQAVEVVGDVVVELDLPGIARQRVRGHGAHAGHGVDPPVGSATHRVGLQQAGRGRHHVAHAAFDLHQPFDDRAAQGADLSCGQAGHGRQALEMQDHLGIRRPGALPGRQDHGHGNGKRRQPRLDGAQHLCHAVHS